MTGAVGVLLAAGAGRRAGGPKALRIERRGTSWLRRSCQVLSSGGCAELVVVLGAEAGRARALLTPEFTRQLPALHVIVASDWKAGMAASLSAGLLAAAELSGTAACVHLVDLPDVGPEVVARLLEQGTAPSVLARATYHGRPGHPVLIGMNHLAGIRASLSGDSGARDYLAGRNPTGQQAYRVDCGDLAKGEDRDEGEPLSP